jgi:hypothetical protein
MGRTLLNLPSPNNVNPYGNWHLLQLTYLVEKLWQVDSQTTLKEHGQITTSELTLTQLMVAPSCAHLQTVF